MFPFFTIGDRRYGTQGIISIVSVVIALGWMVWRFRRRGLERPPTAYAAVDGLFWMVVGGVGGAWVAASLPRVVGALTGGPRLPAGWWQSGQHYMGAVAGFSLGGAFAVARMGQDIGLVLDGAAPVPALLLALYRFGCLATGCCYGWVTESPVGLLMPDIHGVWARRYPTRLISMAANMAIVGILLIFERITQRRLGKPPNWPFPGFLYLFYVQLYCVQRFVFEFWRADMPVLYGPLTWTHLYCAVGMGVATAYMARGFRRARPESLVAVG